MIQGSPVATRGIGLSIGLGLLLALACRADVGERCICADDCKSDLVCVSGGRLLRDGECIPASSDSDPGECVEDADANDGDDDNGGPVLFMDVGSKRDFSPGQPVGSTSGSGASDSGTTGATGSGSDSSGSSGSGTSGSGSSGTTTGGSSSGTSSSGSNGSGSSSSSSTGM